jgi:hypothetical protein
MLPLCNSMLLFLRITQSQTEETQSFTEEFLKNFKSSDMILMFVRIILFINSALKSIAMITIMFYKNGDFYGKYLYSTLYTIGFRC